MTVCEYSHVLTMCCRCVICPVLSLGPGTSEAVEERRGGGHRDRTPDVSAQ